MGKRNLLSLNLVLEKKKKQIRQKSALDDDSPAGCSFWTQVCLPKLLVAALTTAINAEDKHQTDDGNVLTK